MIHCPERSYCVGLMALASASLVLFLVLSCSRRPDDTQLGLDQPIASVDLAPSDRATGEAAKRHLRLAEALEREIAPEEVHTYLVAAEEGQFLHAVVDQKGVDVVASLFDPAGERLVLMDRPNGSEGREPLMALVEVSGDYEVRVESAAEESGGYSVWIEELQSATEGDRARALASRTFSEAYISYREGNYRVAVERFDEARKAWNLLGDHAWEAESLLRLGHAHARLREWRAAAQNHQKAAILFRDEGSARWEAIALQQLGRDYFNLQDMDQAIYYFEKALPLRRRANDRRGEWMTHHTLAHAFQVRDEVQKALDTYEKALALLPSPKDRGHTLHNLGVLYRSLGRMERARDALLEAEKVWAEAAAPRQHSTTLNQLGELHRELGELGVALSYYQQALALRQELKDKRGEVASLANIGLVCQERGEPDRALELYRKALEIVRELQRPRLEARVLLNLGSFYAGQKEPDQALALHRQSLDLYRRAGDPTGEAEALLGLSQAERQRGDLFRAREASDEALRIFESIRPKAVSLESRASFFETVQDHFEFHIDLLMELHSLEPEAGHDARALEVSERARARSLLDLLIEAGAKIRLGADQILLDHEREYQRQLNNLERERLQLREDPGHTSLQMAKAETKIRHALRKLEEVRGEIRVRNPRYAAMTQPLSLAEIQDQILDETTLLLEYRLGKDRSFLWAVTADSLESFELPGRSEIDDLARAAYSLLTNSHRREARDSTRTVLCKVSRQLLQPVEAQLAGKRLLIVSDGALEFIPFAALPEPESLGNCESAPPLVVGHEITHLLSASALAIHRRELKGRPAAPRLLAVVADPVFQATDRRLQRVPDAPEGTGNLPIAATTTAPTRSTAEIDLNSLRRLPFSLQEAEAILSLVDEENSFRAIGLDATKDAVLGGALNDYRIVHFATHGILNTSHPELSGIVLSLVDRDGRPRDGFLRAHEIYTLDLPCDLVVLSACQTALGRVVRGEGLMGLTRGFMHAGAARVAVSLWNVSDQSTAELMGYFYRGLLAEGRSPAAALREAQISIWRNRNRSAPYYWAGFVLQGDWR